MTSAINGTGGPTKPAMQTPAAATRPAEANAMQRAGKATAAKLPLPTAASMPASPIKSEMRGLVKDMAAQPPVDAGKVERLSAQISGGAYRLDPARLADAMIASLQPQRL